MLRRNLIVCLLATLGMASFGNAYAIKLEVQTDKSVVNRGDTVTASIVVSGLGGGAAPSIGGYDLELSYDPSLFSFNSATFGDPVLGNQLDLFFGSFNIADDGFNLANSVNLFEVSFDDPLDLDMLQADTFTLVSVLFDVGLLNTGVGIFGLSVNEVSDAFANSLAIDDLVDASVSVVPVPAAVWLFGSALLGLIGIGRRRAAR